MGTFKCLNCRIGQTIIKNYKGICKKGITEINRTYSGSVVKTQI